MMRALTFRTNATRPQEPRLQAKPCLVDMLPERQVHVFGQNIQKRLPRAFLSSRSVHGRYYYTKVRTARGKGARDATAAAIGMRWNYYLIHGKHTPHFIPQEHHTVAIASGLMNELRHSRSREIANHGYGETHAHTHASVQHAAGVATQSTGYPSAVAQAIVVAGAIAPSTQGGAVTASPQHITFSFSISTSGNAAAGSQDAPVPTHMGSGGYQATAHLTVTSHQAAAHHPATSHQAASLYATFLTTLSLPLSVLTHAYGNATADAQPRMDITLTSSFNPLSQLSFVPTYQVGTYNATQAAVQAVPATITFAPQEHTGAPQGVMTVANPHRKEIGYFSYGKKKAVVLKVAQAADAVPE